MNRDKQIEEMAKDICPLIEEYGNCEKCDAELVIEDEPCLYKCMAKAFHNAGYRKVDRVFLTGGAIGHPDPVGEKGADGECGLFSPCRAKFAREIFDEAIKLAKEIADNSAVIAELEENPIKRIEAKGEQIGALMVLEILVELRKKYTEGER